MTGERKRDRQRQFLDRKTGLASGLEILSSWETKEAQRGEREERERERTREKERERERGRERKREIDVMQHNELRDFTASVLQEVCKDVALEPPLQPLSGEQLRRFANATQEARLYISARGF